MAKFTKEEYLMACYLDLRRAATSFYLKPDGSVHTIFIDHVLKVLKNMHDKKLDKYNNKIIELRKKTLNYKETTEYNRMNLADDILTTGILLKSAF